MCYFFSFAIGRCLFVIETRSRFVNIILMQSAGGWQDENERNMQNMGTKRRARVQPER